MTRFVDQVPLRHERSQALVQRANKCEFVDVVFPVYDDADGQVLRLARLHRGVNLRELAQQASMTAAELTGLETGRLKFADPAERAAFLARLQGGGS